jgi:hypothetical protein
MRLRRFAFLGPVGGMLACVMAFPAAAERAPVPPDADQVFRSDPKSAWRIAKAAHDTCIGQGGDTDDRCFILVAALTEFAVASGNATEGEVLGRRALAYARKAGGGKDTEDLGLAVSNLGFLLHRSGRNKEAEPLIREGLGIYARLFGRTDKDTRLAVGNLASVLWALGRDARFLATWPDVGEAQIGAKLPPYGERRSIKGLTYDRERRWPVPGEATVDAFSGRIPVAIARIEAELVKCRAAAGADDRCYLLEADRAALIRATQGPRDAMKTALELSTIALNLYEGRSPEFLETRADTAQSAYDAGMRGLAETFGGAVFEGYKRLYGPKRPPTIEAQTIYAEYLIGNGKVSEGLPLLQQAWDVAQAEPGFTTQHKVAISIGIARTLASINILDAAEQAAAFVVNTGGDPAMTSQGLLLLAQIRSQRGEYAGAEEMARRAYSLRASLFGGTDRQTLDALTVLAVALQSQRKDAEAETLLRQAVAGLRKSEPGSRALGLALGELAGAIRRRPAEAEPLLVEAIGIFQQDGDPRSPLTLTARANRATMLIDLDRAADAEKEYKALLALWDASELATDPAVASLLANYAGVLVKLNRVAEALPLLARARTIQAERSVATHPHTIFVGIQSGLALRKAAKDRESRHYYLVAQRAIDWRARSRRGDVAAQAEYRSFSGAYTGLIATNWKLAQKRGAN